jgi:predicted nuclease of predicted toxin-antitoxin system
MLRFVTDNDFNEDIVTGLLTERPGLDLVRVREVGFRNAEDPDILAWAASEGRIVRTHDRKTMPAFAYERVRLGQPMPGVFLMRNRAQLRPLIDDILLADELTGMEEWKDKVTHLPF